MANRSHPTACPALEPDVTANVRSRKASHETQHALGFPGELVENWHDVAVDLLGDAVRNHRGLRVWMDACMKCGVCTDKCQFFLGTGDPKNMPVARQDLLRSVYRRHHTWVGRHFPWLVGGRDLDEAMLEDWYTYFHQCSQCRRCAVYCPVGIDTAEFVMAGRSILNRIGVGQHFTNEILRKAQTTGNNLGMPRPALADTLSGLEEDILADTGVAVRLPLDDHGAQLLLVTPSADFFAEPHIDGLIGFAKVMHQAGIRWTLSSEAAEASNFALFIGDPEHMKVLAGRLRDSARRLEVGRLVIGECGHAWRVAHGFLERLAGPLDFLDPGHRHPEHVIELTHELMLRGALRIDPSANDHRRVTYHDSCNIARGASMGGRRGGQFTLPRDVLRTVCRHFFDMDRESIMEKTFCCGAGAGLLSDDLLEVRIKGAAPRMDAYREVVRRHGVTHIAAMCAICKSQLARIFPEYGYERDRVLSVHQLVGDALVL